MVSSDEVKHIATLAKLDITGQEDKLAAMFTETLEKVEVLNELNTTNVVETFQVTGLVNVYQTGEESAVLTKKEALSNAPREVNGLFATDAVFDRN